MDDREQGVTYIELTISMLIASIAVMALVTALRTAFRGNLMAKDKTRAMTLARDRLEEVKNSGYSSLTNRYSNYVYPDNGDPAAPLYQKENVVPYPAVKPSVAEDPWTPETILIGNTAYWRHVVVKFVTENASGKLEQDPLPCPSCVPAEAGGSASSSNLAMIEVDVTWWSRRLSRMQQVRVSTLVANANIPTTTIGEISGTVLDDDTDDNGDNPTNAIVLLPTIGPDDAAIKSQQIIVVARQLETNDTYSTKTSTVDGTYTLSSLPYGGYYVEIRGAPGYRDSAYTGYDEPPGVSSPIKTVTLSPAAIREKNISIFTTKLKRITLHVKIKGVDATVTPQAIRATVDDGVSADYLQTLSGANYDASNPWVFVISNVAVPYTGAVNYTLKVENQTSLTNATARFCVASSVTGGDLYVGWGATVRPELDLPGLVHALEHRLHDADERLGSARRRRHGDRDLLAPREDPGVLQQLHQQPDLPGQHLGQADRRDDRHHLHLHPDRLG